MKRQTNKKKTTKVRTNKGQNGKGDSPRNISEQFKNNYDKIDWRKK